MSEEWVTVASFFTPPQPEPAFEDNVAAEVERFAVAAREAGLAPEQHIRVTRGAAEVTIDVSPALDTAFNPVQTLWKAE
jgi:hypothetical protein